MKINYIKGFDRIAILLAIPMALWGACYSYEMFIKYQRVLVYSTEEELCELKTSYYKTHPEPKSIFQKAVFMNHMRTFECPNADGIIADGEEELILQSTKRPLARCALDRAFEEGADPCGTLVKGQSSDQYYLLPRKSKRFIVGLFGAFCFGIITIMGVGLSVRIITRVFSWVKKGFES